MKEIEYISRELIAKLDELSVDNLLKLKVMLYLHHSLKDEEILDNNCKVLDKHYITRKKIDESEW